MCTYTCNDVIISEKKNIILKCRTFVHMNLLLCTVCIFNLQFELHVRENKSNYKIMRSETDVPFHNTGPIPRPSWTIAAVQRYLRQYKIPPSKV